MKKRTYKRMKNRLYREMQEKIYEKMLRVGAECKIAAAEERAEHAEITAEDYRRRFAEFGTNVETIETGENCLVKTMKWELTPQQWGKYTKQQMDIRMEVAEQVKEIEKDLVCKIANGLIENNLVQFVLREAEPFGGPLTAEATIGAKLFVIPWEQLPKYRSNKIELRKLIGKGEAESEGAKDD